MPDTQTTCSSCGAPIMFIRSAKDPNKRFCLNQEEVLSDGKNPKLRIVDDYGLVLVNPAEGLRGRVVHQATCPFVNRYRKPKT